MPSGCHRTLEDSDSILTVKNKVLGEMLPAGVSGM